MPMVQDIVKYIVANLGSTWIDPEVSPTTGNIFMEQEPTVPDQCVCVYQLPGKEPKMTFGAHYAWEEPRLRITSRASTAQGFGGAASDAKAIWDLLKPVVNQTLNGVFYMKLTPSGSPAAQLLDPNNRPVYVQEFAVMKYLS
jgi:Bacteriophage minor capsid protein